MILHLDQSIILTITYHQMAITRAKLEESEEPSSLEAIWPNSDSTVPAYVRGGQIQTALPRVLFFLIKLFSVYSQHFLDKHLERKLSPRWRINSGQIDKVLTGRSTTLCPPSFIWLFQVLLSHLAISQSNFILKIHH